MNRSPNAAVPFVALMPTLIPVLHFFGVDGEAR